MPYPLTREDRVQAVLQAFVLAAEKFIQKVDDGKARSITTYAELKHALELKRAYNL